MLPPYCPEVAQEIACPRGGATPKQPSIGSILSSCSASRPGRGVCSRIEPFSMSRSQRSTCGSVGGLGRGPALRSYGMAGTNPGSITQGATSLPVKPTDRFGHMRSKCTASVSPGSAPST